MAEVYWIRLPEHTDMFTQGYIGMTRHTAKNRYACHKSLAKRSKTNLPILNAIRKHGENLLLQTLVICSNDYAVWLENKLRPSKGIGWNLATGGEFPATDRVITDEARRNMSIAQTGRKHSEETILKMKNCKSNSERVWTDDAKARISAANTGRVASDETRKKLSLAGMGRKQTEESIEKTTIGKFYFYMKKNVKVYSIAAELYSYFLEGLTYSKVEYRIGAAKGSLHKIFKHFIKGWVPHEDPKWVEWEKSLHSENT